jgi:poly(3-hydroxybutyrate) depolymerase
MRFAAALQHARALPRVTARLVFRAALLLGLPSAVGAQSMARASSTASPFAYDARTPAEWRESLVRSADGVEEYVISFASPLGGRVTGKMFRPAGPVPAKRYAAMLFGHGAPGNSDNLGPRGVYFARKGAIVVGIDAAFARRNAREPLSFTVRDSVEQVQTIVDFRRLVDILSARPDVDATRLAYVGISYGGAMGAVLAGVEPRLAAYALAVGDLGFVAHFREPDGTLGGPLTDVPAAQRDRWVAAMEPVSGTTFFPRAEGHKLFLQNNTKDEAVRPHVARSFHAAAPRGAQIRWYESGHRLTPAHYYDQLVFLHDRIGLSAPTPQDAAGPVFPPPA